MVTNLSRPIFRAKNERLDSQVQKRLFVEIADQDEAEPFD